MMLSFGARWSIGHAGSECKVFIVATDYQRVLVRADFFGLSVKCSLLLWVVRSNALNFALVIAVVILSAWSRVEGWPLLLFFPHGTFCDSVQDHLLFKFLSQLDKIIGLRDGLGNRSVSVWRAVLLLVDAWIEDVVGSMRINLLMNNCLADRRLLQIKLIRTLYLRNARLPLWCNSWHQVAYFRSELYGAQSGQELL